MRSGRLPGYPREGKDYLLHLLCALAPDNGFVQDAIEWELCEHRAFALAVTGYPERDANEIMGCYDGILISYREHLAAEPLAPVFDYIRKAA